VINGVDYAKVKGAYYYGTMITYFPADNPRYTIITSIFSKNHGDEKYYGATLAGPVQQRVASFLHNRDKEYVEQLSSESHYVQDIKGGSVESMREVAGEYAKEYTASERSGWGTSSLRGKSQEVVISQENMPNEQVPNVVGMGLSDALYLLESRGLVVEIEGAGKVVKQSVEAGSAVKQGDKIKIVLK
jgi:cell division protein FtsI (penicillin-binding protein 3)